MEKTETKGKVIINPEMTFDDNDLCFFLTGLNMEQFADAILHDTTGKYDAIYEETT